MFYFAFLTVHVLLFTDVYSEPCFFTLNNSNGIISSDPTGNYSSCSWVVTAPLHHNILLNFTIFHLPASPVNGKCYVQVYDGRDISETLLGNFTGRRGPFPVQSSGRYMLIKLIKKRNAQPSNCNFTAVYFSSTSIGELFCIHQFVLLLHSTVLCVGFSYYRSYIVIENTFFCYRHIWYY